MPLAELPQTNKQHAVPQNIMDVEFKLIGDLTMRQFMYLLVFGGIAYVAAVVVVGIFKLPLMAISALLGFGLAFVPVQDRGLDEWLVNFFKSVYGPSQRIWMKEVTIPSALLYENINVVKQEMIALAPTSSRRKLEEYLRYQGAEQNVDPLDIPEAQYIKMVKDAYAGTKYQTPAPAPSVSVGVLEPEEELPEELPEGEPDYEPQGKPEELEQQPSETSPAGESKAVRLVEEPRQVSVRTAPVVSPITYTPRAEASSPVGFNPITPDMHAGRRFTNLLPYGGEIVLPIRGEKVLMTAEQVNVEEDIKDKAEKLNKLLSQIKGSGDFNDATVPVVQTSGDRTPETVVKSEAEVLAAKLQEENERISGEIERLKATQAPETDIAGITQKEQMIRELEVQKERKQEEYAKLEQQVLDLQNKLKEKEQFSGGAGSGPSTIRPVYAKIQPITTIPNVVTGIVKKEDEGVLEGVLLIIKNEKGEAVRAFKTNTLGQFSLSTPVTNGLYTVEVSNDKGANLSFDIISIEAKGEVIPPLEIIGKVKV